MEDLTNWIAINKDWLFEGIGVVVITGIIAFFWKKRKSDPKNPASNNITGDSNLQAGRDINIINETEKKSPKRPIIELELVPTGKGKKSRGISEKNSKNEAIMVTEVIRHFELHWDFQLIIRNNSSTTAYGISLDWVNGEFDYLEKLNSMKPLLANEELILNCNVYQPFEGIGRDSKRMLTDKYPDKIKELFIKVNYKDEERNEFTSIFKIENGKQVNEF